MKNSKDKIFKGLIIIELELIQGFSRKRSTLEYLVILILVYQTYHDEYIWYNLKIDNERSDQKSNIK